MNNGSTDGQAEEIWLPVGLVEMNNIKLHLVDKADDKPRNKKREQKIQGSTSLCG
jgi:hypothetical protein